MTGNIVWKPLFGHSDTFEISEFGQVRRVKEYLWHKPGGVSGIGHILKPWVASNGHIYTAIKGKNKTVARLVAATFIGGLGKDDQIIHIDDNLLNNHYSNLGYRSPTEIKLRALANLAKARLYPGNHSTPRKLKCSPSKLATMARLRSEGQNYTFIAKVFGIDPATVKKYLLLAP